MTGASMGGQGTDQLMFDHGPNSVSPIFAAGYSMAGWMVNETPQQFVAAIGNAPMEAVHGTADTTNPPGWDQAVAAIDPNFHLTQIQGAGHDARDPESWCPRIFERRQLVLAFPTTDARDVKSRRRLLQHLPLQV